MRVWERFSLKRWAALGLAFAAGALASRAIPSAAASGQNGTSADSDYRELSRFSRVLAHIENSHLAPPGIHELADGAIRGMVAALDPHSAFLSADEIRAMEAQRRNGLTADPGLALTMTPHEVPGGGGRISRLTVVAPLDGSPAALAGILPGDKIVHIDGKPTLQLDPGMAEALLAGEEGSRVTVGVLRQGFSAVRNFTLLRAAPKARQAEASLLEGGVGLIRIKRFDKGTAKDVGADLKALAAKVPGGLKGLVLDLRNNPGGRLDEAARVADFFLPGGRTIYTLKGRGGTPLEAPESHSQNTEPPYPVAILVNDGTASAAELVAGALQDEKRAVLVGGRTFGKGSVQLAFGLDDGSALKLTVARYQTPSGREIHGRGLEPDWDIGRLEVSRLDFPLGIGHRAPLSGAVSPQRELGPGASGDLALAVALGWMTRHRETPVH